MVQPAVRLMVGVALILVVGFPVAAGPVPGVPPGVQPLPVDPRGCDPVGDEERYLRTVGPGWVAYAGHGIVCLDEGRYADAIPLLERAVSLNATPRDLAALGVAYDGVGQFRAAADRWHLARRLWSARFSVQHYDFDHPLGLESALFERRYAAALKTLEQLFAPGSTSPHAPYRNPLFYDLGILQPLTEALRVAAQGNPQRGAELISGLYRQAGWFGEVRYPRAIMLLAVGRREEARFELRLAARKNAPVTMDDGPYDFQWSALAILEHLGQPSEQ